MTESWPPAGVRFFPADDILITAYLSNRIHGHPLPVDGAVIEAEIYGQGAEPSQLFLHPDASWQTRVDACGKFTATESVRYVFTRLAKVGKGTGSKQMSRVTGAGYWHGNRAEKVEDEAGNRVGTKKIFKFKENGDNVNHSTHYIMHEYSTLCCEDIVLCKVKRINREKRNRGILDNVDDSAKKSKAGDYVDPIMETHDQDGRNAQDQSFTMEDMELQAFFMNTCY